MFGYYYRHGPKISNRLGLTLILIYVGLSFGFVYLAYRVVCFIFSLPFRLWEYLT
jgi:hypothetical protein